MLAILALHPTEFRNSLEKAVIECNTPPEYCSKKPAFSDRLSREFGKRLISF